MCVYVYVYVYMYCTQTQIHTHISQLCLPWIYQQAVVTNIPALLGFRASHS